MKEITLLDDMIENLDDMCENFQKLCPFGSMIKIAYRVNDQDTWIIPNWEKENKFGYFTFKYLFDFMTSFGDWRTPFSIKDVFDCVTNSLLGMESTTSLFENTKYKVKIGDKLWNSHSLK